MTLSAYHYIAGAVLALASVAGMYLKVIPTELGCSILAGVAGLLVPTTIKTKQAPSNEE